MEGERLHVAIVEQVNLRELGSATLGGLFFTGSGSEADFLDAGRTTAAVNTPECLTSATARDVLGEILLNLDAAGYRVVMHIHDEVVVEVPTADVDNALIDIHRIMTTAPEWLEGLPLAAETTTSTFYTK